MDDRGVYHDKVGLRELKYLIDLYWVEVWFDEVIWIGLVCFLYEKRYC